MALFSSSEWNDWEVSEAGEKLFQTFQKDDHHKKKHKNRRKPAKIVHQNIQNGIRQLGNMVSNKSGKISKAPLMRKIKSLKQRKKSYDETPLNRDREHGSKRKLISTSSKSNHEVKQAKIKNNMRDKLVNGTEQIISKMAISQKTNEGDFKTPLIKKRKETNHKKNEYLKLPESQCPGTAPSKIDKKILKKRKLQLEKLKQLVAEKGRNSLPLPKQQEPVLTLRQKMTNKLKVARFRYLNEQIYTTTGKQIEKIFKQDPDAFKAYHEGYRLQVEKWPLNPVDKIISAINKMNKSAVVADFGCGEAKLAKSVEQEVHSFDLIATNELVTACDMSRVPLEHSSVDVAVFCLSLMGTNLNDYIKEANRILKVGGIMKIAEVESRFEDINSFVKDCERFGFRKLSMDLSHNLFYFIDFKKESNITSGKKIPALTLQPCLYKKR